MTTRHRAALVGVWHVHAADYLREARARDGVAVVAVWDQDPVELDRFATENGVSAVGSLDAVLAEPSIDSVIVAAATTEHEGVIRASLAAGKHVFVEKPLALTTVVAQELQSMAARVNLVLHTSFQRLTEPWVGAFLSLIDSGALGRVSSTQIRYDHDGAVAGWLPDRFLDPALAGGGPVLADFAAHGLYLSQILHGGFPTSLIATASSITSRQHEDDALVVLRFADGSRSVLETSVVSASGGHWARISGSTGSAFCDPVTSLVLARDTGGEEWYEVPNPAPEPGPVDRFFSAVERGAQHPDPNLQRAIRLAALLEAANESVRLDRGIETVDPVGPASL